jgi:hypothetical protein
MDREQFKNSLFSGAFSEELALELFRFQSLEVPIYRKYVDLLGKDRESVVRLEEIPFLPIQFFKQEPIGRSEVKGLVFRSSGTTGQIPSVHYVSDEELYKSSILNGFEALYGSPDTYSFRFLLPSYLERSDSSLVHMARYLHQESGLKHNSFFMRDIDALIRSIQEDKSGRRIFLLGVSFALLELAAKKPEGLKNAIIMETGGMKGRGRELIRRELHDHLMEGLGVENIHGEYGMTELLSQAYAKSEGLYSASSTMRILIRRTDDPFSYETYGKTGAINVIDLCNMDSCAFIATDDLGRIHPDGRFEVLGRFDQAELRGCNLMTL